MLVRVRELEKQCRKLRPHLERFFSPWVIEFSGLPRAGKTETISIVDHFFRRNEVRVSKPPEGALIAPDQLKDRLLSYNTWTATYAIRQIIEGCYSPQRNSDMILLDRGLFDATAWFHFLETNQRLSAPEREALCRFVRLGEWKSQIQNVFLFTCSPKVSIQRERSRKLTEKGGIIMKPAVIGALSRAYTNAYNCYKSEFQITRINTTKIRPRQVAIRVVSKILSDIEKRI